MGISPWQIGQTRPTWSITWLDDSKTAINLTGASVVMRISLYGGVGYTGTGTLIVTGPTLGQFTYLPALADFPTAGNYTVETRATYGDGTVLYSDPLFLVVNPAI